MVAIFPRERLGGRPVRQRQGPLRLAGGATSGRRCAPRRVRCLLDAALGLRAAAAAAKCLQRREQQRDRGWAQARVGLLLGLQPWPRCPASSEARRMPTPRFVGLAGCPALAAAAASRSSWLRLRRRLRQVRLRRPRDEHQRGQAPHCCCGPARTCETQSLAGHVAPDREAQRGSGAQKVRSDIVVLRRFALLGGAIVVVGLAGES
mmetsp:Transcript_103418/g.299192  ORF Transcript_103418/g.299192 Transcript_103418/m.299192 type:complete len:206 (-) Transcript_103418:744-1361(-)